MLIAALALCPHAAFAQPGYFEIRVVDADGMPVSGVELRTVNELRFRSDDQGRIAFHEPGMMGTDVWFHVSAPHAEVFPDVFDYRGARLAVTEGGVAELVVARTGAAAGPSGDLETRRLARGLPAPEGWFGFRVVDRETGRGVPLVELAFVDGDLARPSMVSDSAGWFAIDPLDLEDAPVEVTLSSHAYGFADGGRQALSITPGGRVTVLADREMIAERLYRVTGGGIYRDSVLLGLEVPIERPVINGLVLGQDSVFTAVHRGRVHWIWGDTNRVAYPLGQFQASGAVSAFPRDGGLDPELGVNLTYFVGADGFSRPMAPRETVPGAGLVWLGGLVSVPDAGGEERLFALYGMYASLAERTRFGMLRYDDATERFEDVVTFDGPDERYPRENAFLVDHGDARFVYYHQSVRIPARAEALVDPETYEAFTPYTDVAASEIERDERGAARYRFRAGGIRRATAADRLGADGLEGHVIDIETGARVADHDNGSTEYNDYTGRYARLVLDSGALGDIWFGLADTPMGPWIAVERIVHHDDYSFYNPRQHSMLDADFGRRIFFEGTYTSSFSGATEQTPRYDYNQVMYGLSLDREALAVPVSIYESERGELGPHEVIAPGDAPIVARFLAPVRARAGTEAVYWSGPSCEPRRLLHGGEPLTPPLFYARTGDPAGAHQTLLYEIWGDEGDSPRYAIEPSGNAHRFAVVWRNPIRVALPVGEYRRPPFADAGPDRCLEEGETLTLDAGSWRLNGASIEAGGLALAAGLHVLTRVVTREDGFAIEDHAIVRIGAAPPLPPPPAAGCGCRAIGSSSAPGVPLALLVVLTMWVSRRSAAGRRGAAARRGAFRWAAREATTRR